MATRPQHSGAGAPQRSAAPAGNRPRPPQGRNPQRQPQRPQQQQAAGQRPRLGGAQGGAPSRSKFIYKERSIDSVKQRAERTGGRFDSIFKPNVDTFRAKVGDNLIRILPPTWDDYEHYGYQIFVHRYVGPDKSTYLCPRKMLNKRCAICDAEKASRDAGEHDEAKALAPAEQFVMWVIDRDADSTTPQLYQASWTMDRDIAALTHDKRKGRVLLIDHPYQGYDLTIKRSGSGLNTKYFGLAIDREATPIFADQKDTDEVLSYITENPVPTMLHYHDNDYLTKMLSGGAEEFSEDDQPQNNEDVADEATEDYVEGEEGADQGEPPFEAADGEQSGEEYTDDGEPYDSETGELPPEDGGEAEADEYVEDEPEPEAPTPPARRPSPGSSQRPQQQQQRQQRPAPQAQSRSLQRPQAQGRPAPRPAPRAGNRPR